MKKTLWSLAALTLLGAIAFWAVAAEEGAYTAPISIRTESELAAISGGEESVGRHYVLENDIHIAGSWIPLNDFRGHFDGQGYTIRSLTNIVGGSSRYGGLFGTTYSADIRNVTLITTWSVSFGRYYAGGLIGRAVSTSVYNVHISGGVASARVAGGIIGVAYDSPSGPSTIINSSATVLASVSAPWDTWDAIFDSGFYAGGLIGVARATYYGLQISDSFFAGRVYMTRTRDYYRNIPPIPFVGGGLIGAVYASNYATNCGFGLVEISNSYSIATIELRDLRQNISDSYPIETYVGGLVGFDWQQLNPHCNCEYLLTATNSFRLYNQDITIQPYRFYPIHINQHGIPLTYTQMRSRDSFTGWDFDSVWEFRAGENDGFPVLRGQIPPEPTPTPVPSPTPAPTEAPTPSPTPAPTATPTPTPTPFPPHIITTPSPVTPTPAPSPTPASTPSPTPSPQPPSPSPRPATPSPSPSPRSTTSPSPSSAAGNRPNPQTSPIQFSFAIFSGVILFGIAGFGIASLTKKHIAQVNQHKTDVARQDREDRIADLLDKK